MDDEIYEKYKRAGIIAAKARDYGVDLIKPGISFLDVTEKIENKIRENNAKPAFPVNISINEIAAHFTPMHDSEIFFEKGNVVKLDVGVQIDGYIADTAVTVEVETNNYDEMIQASSDALDNAISKIKAGVNLSEVGKIIHKTISSFGFKPIDNLTGHSLNRYELHSGISVPNVEQTIGRKSPQAGDVLAIEPFATNGAGHVTSGTGSNIYICGSAMKLRLLRDNKSIRLFEKMKKTFNDLPFAQRWVEQNFPNNTRLLKKLTFLGMIKHYPQLIEKNGRIVTQKEHTVIVNKDGCEVTTYP